MTTDLKNGFIVLSVLGVGSYQPCYHEDDKLMFFTTAEAAQEEINSHIDDVADAVKNGDMEEEYSLDDYMVHAATKDGEGYIRCTVDGIDYIMHETDDDYLPETKNA